MGSWMRFWRLWLPREVKDGTAVDTGDIGDTSDNEAE
jgi:hypothetical protein